MLFASPIIAARENDVSLRFNPNVHGARGLFALMIILFHVVNSRLPTFDFLGSGAPYFLLRTSEFAVELFFGISGIVIVGALKRAKSPVHFWIERATRIYPLLWVTILVILASEIVANYNFAGTVSPKFLPLVIVANFLAIPGVVNIPIIHPAAWSLSYELLFYFGCTVVWVLRQRLGSLAKWIYLPFCILLFGIYVRGFLILSGLLVADRFKLFSKFRILIRFPLFWLLSFLIFWEFVDQRCDGKVIDNSVIDLMKLGLFPYAAFAMFSGTLALAGIFGGFGLLSRALRSRIMQFAGTISFSLYLWHPFIMSAIKRAMYKFHLVDHLGHWSQIFFLLTASATSLIIATYSQRLIEQRVTRWLRHRIEGRKGDLLVRSHAA